MGRLLLVQSHDARYAWGMDARTPILETIQLGCACSLTG